MTRSEPSGEHIARPVVDLWTRRGGAILVAAVAAYASYEHQYAFARQGGADGASAGMWPLSVDGLLILATAGLLRAAGSENRRMRLVSWLAFGLGIGVSLAWQPVLVAGWPPVALLLAVELITHGPGRRELNETALASDRESTDMAESPTAEAVMWDHFQRELCRGRTPSGAELDRIAGTNNFGRAVLRRWRREGRVPPITVLRLGTRTTADTSNGHEPTSGTEGVQP